MKHDPIGLNGYQLRALIERRRRTARRYAIGFGLGAVALAILTAFLMSLGDGGAVVTGTGAAFSLLAGTSAATEA